MDLPIGDAATWFGGLAQWGAVGASIWAVQSQRATDFAERLRDELGLDDGDIAAQVVTRPELASLVMAGVEDAIRSHATDQRWLLAKVVAGGFGIDARIDEHAIFLRTGAALEPIDTQVLLEVVRVRMPLGKSTPLTGTVTEAELADRIEPDQKAFLKPVLARLTREGLLVDRALGTWGYGTPALICTPYAHKFLRFVPGRGTVTGPPTVVGWFAADRDVGIRNLGPGAATITSVTLRSRDGDVAYAALLGERLEAGEELTYPVRFPDQRPPDGPRLEVRWDAGAGEQVFDSAAGE